jgi:hypothetical protein
MMLSAAQTVPPRQTRNISFDGTRVHQLIQDCKAFYSSSSSSSSSSKYEVMNIFGTQQKQRI